MNEIYEFGPFRLEVRERRLTSKGNPIRLRPKVFDTLCVLVERHGSLVGKNDLMKLVWPETVVEENNLALNITVLRKALGEADPEGKWIETVTGKGYRFLGEVRAGADVSQHGSAPAGVADAESELLERDAEISSLRDCLQHAIRGQRQFVCVTGEAGIGKTALLSAFLSELASRGGSLLIGKGQCVERSGEGEAYMPILEALGRLCRESHGAEIIDLLERYAPTWLVQLPSLVEPGAYPVLRERVLGVTRDRMLRELAEALEAIAGRYPLVLVVEDLHWADPSTIELISALARRQEPARFFLIGTNRGRDAGESGRTLESLTEELHLRGQCQVIRLRLLSEDAIAQLVEARMPDSAVNAQLASVIRQRTSGNPLFAHALLDYWVDHGGDAPVPVMDSVLPRGIPGTLTAMIQRKLAGLRKEDREILECACVAGISFSSATVADVLKRDEEEVESRCSDLAANGTLLRDSGLIEWPDGTASASFTFEHSLYQEVLYEQIPPGRRARLHRRTGEHLTRTLGETATQRAAELAHHFVAGRDAERALVYLEAAAKAALHRSAAREAAVHLRRGLSLLKTLPGTPENQAREFRLLAMFAPTVIATEGFSAAEAEPSYQRAFELGQQLGDMERAYPVLLGRAFMHELRGEYFRTEELLNRHLKLPEAEQGSLAAVHADSLLACSLFHQGKFNGALERAEHGLGIYDPARDRELLAPYGENPSVACQSWAALCLWFLGFPDRAVDRALRLVSFSETPNHSFALSTAAMYATHVFQLRREHVEASKWADMTLRLAEAQGYLYNVAFAKVVKGWACVGAGATEDGLELVKQGLAIAGMIGAKLDQPYLLALAAEAQIACGRHAAALDSIAKALSLVQASRAFFYEAELYRLRGAAELKRGKEAADTAKGDLKLAVEVARRQGAKSLELRAATSLARLLVEQGQVKSARQILKPLYVSFEEGLQTPDLREAGDLLASLTTKAG
jgi:DNA-binding winged helix-turn-helix (wHTH) protein/predicted ATPase